MIDAVYFFFLMIRRPPRSTLFPTRRSSDLASVLKQGYSGPVTLTDYERYQHVREALKRDRKSTRLNSSHLVISYAVFCLKKKKKKIFFFFFYKKKKKKKN